MATLNGLYSFTPSTAAKASEVNANFNAVKAFVDAITTGVNIDGSAITESKINNGAISEVKIANNAVTTDKINALAVTEAKIAANAVTTAKINAAAVTNAKLNNGVSGDIPLITVSTSAATGGKNGDVWIVV
jgi:hypothetical protein